MVDKEELMTTEVEESNSMGKNFIEQFVQSYQDR